MLVLTQGRTLSPRSTAFFASSPAPTITLGFDVFVHDVIAAITTVPSPISASTPASSRELTYRPGRRSVGAATAAPTAAVEVVVSCAEVIPAVAGPGTLPP